MLKTVKANSVTDGGSAGLHSKTMFRRRPFRSTNASTMARTPHCRLRDGRHPVAPTAAACPAKAAFLGPDRICRRPVLALAPSRRIRWTAIVMAISRLNLRRSNLGTASFRPLMTTNRCQVRKASCPARSYYPRLLNPPRQYRHTATHTRPTDIVTRCGQDQARSLVRGADTAATVFLPLHTDRDCRARTAGSARRGDSRLAFGRGHPS